MARIIIPTPLRKFTDNQASVEIEGQNVLQALESLTKIHPNIEPHLLDQEGKPRKFIRLYVGDEDIQALDREQTALESHSVISIVPAIAGGRE